VKFFSKVFHCTPLILTGMPNKVMNFRLLIEPDLLDKILIVAIF